MDPADTDREEPPDPPPSPTHPAEVSVTFASIDVIFDESASANATVRSRRPGERAAARRAMAAEPLPPAPAEPLAEQSARFEDEGEIARGGMGSIRKVFDRRLMRHEAMKLIDPSIERGSRALDRFVEEARINGQLDHPNIVPIYDLGVSADGTPSFITMKVVVGETLGAHFDALGDDRLKTPHLERTLEMLIKVCDALSFAHSRGVVHCDVKPGNVMIGSHGQVYVMDWGLAQVQGAAPVEFGGRAAWRPRPADQGVIMGTPAYMAPEQAHGRVDQVDARTDVYCLGGVLYRLLTARPPHSEATVIDTVKRAREGKITPPEEVLPETRLPPELCRIALKALAADPAARYQTVEQLKAELEMFLRGGGWLPTRTFPEGAVILSEGEAADAAYIIVEGICEAYKTLGGKRVSLRLMGPGEVFGEAAVFTSQPRTASVAAMSAVTLKVVTGESLKLELSRNAWMWALVKALADRFRDLDGQLGRLADKR